MKIFGRKFNLVSILNILVIILLLILPYYLFSGKLFIGGDDTRLFYSYPLEFLTNISFFSWYKVSSLGISGPSQYMVPFLSLWSVLSFIISDKASLNYLAMSAPLILGFIYFQKAIKELFNLDKKNDMEVFLGSLFYVLSPILMINQLFIFLISIWLIALIPTVIYYFLKYLRTSNFLYVFIASLWILVLGQAIYSIPWLTGFVLPVVLGLISVSILFKKRQIFYFLNHLIVFSVFVFLSQAYWFTGFVSTYLNLDQDSFASKFLSKGFVDTFTPTILATATGNIFYPLLNLFHRQIPFDFWWKLKDVFISFYDITFILNSIFVLVLFLGILNSKKYLSNINRRTFVFLLTSFTFSLYFFTVNIGPLKDLFILFGQIPGFTMFRNFFDKFAPGYVIIYSALITICLILVSRRFNTKRFYILFSFFLVVLLNFIPVREVVNSPLWTTESIYKAINIPREYLSFMTEINGSISSSNNIFSIPFGSSAYSVIKEDNSNNVYAGVSPVKIFSGINDISGHLSFNFTKTADIVDSLIVNRKYSDLNRILFEHNINYVLQTKNVPLELANSYLFNPDLFRIQDKEFVDQITGKKVKVSSSGNYVLYEAKEKNSLINSKNVYFKKISQVKYVVYIKGLTEKQDLSFVDSYHAGWKLYLQKNPSLDSCKNPIKNPNTNSTECKSDNMLFQFNDLTYLFAKPIFNNTHTRIYDFANQWIIDSTYIKNNFDNSFYKQNENGNIDIELVLYFKPQIYFYIGVIISLLTFISALTYLIKKKNEKNK